jgi:hypothetical protein
MKLTRKHIGKLIHVSGSDGSWAYQLLDIKNGEVLFYDLGGKFEIAPQNKYDDWAFFKPATDYKEWIEYGWKSGRRERTND